MLRGSECDPRRLKDADGDNLCVELYRRHGQGVLLIYYQVAGGDVVRNVRISTEDDVLHRRLVEIFGGAEWWDFYQTVQEAACSSSPAH
jgi:hypothetical protein